MLVLFADLWDHPRVCGEHRKQHVRHYSRQGSSPRMRGTLLTHGVERAIAGIIPAYAGNTNLQGIGIAQWRDHPRVCGEHPTLPWISPRSRGSSPRMRGTRWDVHRWPLPAGIIPAYAGNTHRRAGRTPFVRDHPRVCGEHHRTQSHPYASMGSSPRMRGTPCDLFLAAIEVGIIPAYAGNTITSAEPR